MLPACSDRGRERGDTRRKAGLRLLQGGVMWAIRPISSSAWGDCCAAGSRLPSVIALCLTLTRTTPDRSLQK